jgi:hypothetical protein
MPNKDYILQVKRLQNGRKIVGVGIDIVSILRLLGSAVPSPIIGNCPKSMICKEHHLRIPLIGARGPGMREHNRLPSSPVPIKQLRTVVCFQDAHTFLLLPYGCGEVAPPFELELSRLRA